MPDESIVPPPEPAGPAPAATARRADPSRETKPDRTRLGLLWYRMVQWFFSTLIASTCGLRASGRENVPGRGAAMLVSNHLSHLDVLVLGILLDRPLNYVARSSLFFFPLGPFIRSCGAFPIQRDGIGAQGLKETLRRLKSGGIVTLFPEGTRTTDGELGELKPGIALLAAKARVPILPAAIAGTFEAWPRSRPFPSSHPIHVHFGRPIPAEQVKSLAPEELTALIRERILECQAIARGALARLPGAEEG
jgi:1-acyl-sn-glycerol-3-phosphate acyltransferase